MISRNRRGTFSAVVASVLVERILDFAALLVVISSFAAFSDSVPALVSMAGYVSVAIIVLATLFVVVMRRPPKLVSKAVSRMSNWLPSGILEWVKHQVQLSRRGFTSLNSTPKLFVALVASLAQWISIILAIYWSGLAIGVSGSPAAVLVTFVLLVLGLTLPNSPLQIGTTQLSFAIGFSIDGVSANLAVAASVVYTVFLIIPTVVSGGAMAVRYLPRGTVDAIRYDQGGIPEALK